MITPNGRGYFDPVELYIRHGTSGHALTYSFTKLAR